jgi:hypothetical protein
MFINFFPSKIVNDIMYSHTGHRCQYNTAHALAGWITEATNTHSEYVIFIAFTLQQWLRERASGLCYKYSILLVLF